MLVIAWWSEITEILCSSWLFQHVTFFFFVDGFSHYWLTVVVLNCSVQRRSLQVLIALLRLQTSHWTLNIQQIVSTTAGMSWVLTTPARILVLVKTGGSESQYLLVSLFFVFYMNKIILARSRVMWHGCLFSGWLITNTNIILSIIDYFCTSFSGEYVLSALQAL